jgi:hypothetical protein
LRCFVLLLACAASPADAVVNGTVVNGPWNHQYPVGLFERDAFPPFLNGATCSNLLIAPDWVLTAGICAGSIANGMRDYFDYLVDYDSCGQASGQVAEVFADPNTGAQLVHLDHLCDLHYFMPLILNDGSPPAAGSQLYDMGWGGASDEPLTGITSVTDKADLGSGEIAFTGANLFCTGTDDDGGLHFGYASNGFPVAYALFDHSDPGCTQYNVSIRIDALINFITSHVTNACLASDPTGPHCDGLFRNGMDPPLN